LWFLNEIGLKDNAHFQAAVEQLLKMQTVEGYIHSNQHQHSGPLRSLVATRPNTESLANALNYWLRNWRDYSDDYRSDGLAVGILALTELDYERYKGTIREQVDFLKGIQNEDGTWGRHTDESGKADWFNIMPTSYAIWAISRAEGIEDAAARNGLRWLKSLQLENGSWENREDFTSMALIGLLAMGEGPKVPFELVENENMRLRQNIERQAPIFCHTSPLYKQSLHVKSINDTILTMLRKAVNEIRIASPFFDIFYEEIINLKRENQSIHIKIITRPKKEAEGTRERIAKNVIDLLNTVSEGNVVQSELVHARMVIIDDQEALISSADLTRDQLFDEFNAGIWTSDRRTVIEAINFFENLFQLEKKP
jgi:phosphatidylserine/phosphatidylglycerophosphate/cardiolipin synthase-like enzyme